MNGALTGVLPAPRAAPRPRRASCLARWALLPPRGSRAIGTDDLQHRAVRRTEVAPRRVAGPLDLREHLQALLLQAAPRRLDVFHLQTDHRSGREEGMVGIDIGVDVELGVGAEPEPGRTRCLTHDRQTDEIAEKGHHLVEAIGPEADESDAFGVHRVGGSNRPKRSGSAAAAHWIAFRAAPLRRLSLLTHRANPRSRPGMARSRPTSTGSRPSTSSGIG